MKIRNPFKRKPLPPTHGEKLATAKVKSTTALSMFAAAHNKLDEANSELSVLIADAQNKVAELSQHINDAHDEIFANRTVQQKLVDFVR